MPPEWYDSAAEGDERDVGGTTWFVKEVNGPVIWWARSRYGKAEACSQKPGPQGGFNGYDGYGGAPHPYAYNPYASPVGQAFQKSQQGIKAEQEYFTGVKCSDTEIAFIGKKFNVDCDCEFTFCAPGHEMKLPTTEATAARMLIESMEREWQGIFSENCACGLSGCSPASAGPSSGEQPENDH